MWPDDASAGVFPGPSRVTGWKGVDGMPIQMTYADFARLAHPEVAHLAGV